MENRILLCTSQLLDHSHSHNSDCATAGHVPCQPPEGQQSAVLVAAAVARQQRRRVGRLEEWVRHCRQPQALRAAINSHALEGMTATTTMAAGSSNHESTSCTSVGTAAAKSNCVSTEWTMLRWPPARPPPSTEPLAPLLTTPVTVALWNGNSNGGEG